MSGLDDAHLGALIRKARQDQGVGLREFAHQVELPHSTLAKIEAGQRAVRGVELVRIAAELGVSVEEFQSVLLQISSASIVALDEFWTLSGSGGDKVTLMDTIEDRGAPDPSRAYDIQAVKELLAAAIKRLPEREKIVIGLYYYEGLTLKEIGEILGVTESRISQLHTKAILRLKGRVKEDLEPASLTP